MQAHHGAPDGAISNDKLWWMAVAPPVSAVRPAHCPHCGVVGRHLDGDVVVEGNGVRRRHVVIPVFDGGLRFARITCWSRRFRCSSCHRSTVALPAGVLPGCLYSVAAIVVAWWASSPMMNATTRGLEAVCAPEGVDRRSSVEGAPRWRTPHRWARLLTRIVSNHVCLGGNWRHEVDHALVLLAVQAPDLSAEALARAATGAHARRGMAM